MVSERRIPQEIRLVMLLKSPTHPHLACRPNDLATSAYTTDIEQDTNNICNTNLNNLFNQVAGALTNHSPTDSSANSISIRTYALPLLLTAPRQ